MSAEFVEFGKIPRLNREIIITEKIDGTNAQILIDRVQTEARAGLEPVGDELAVVRDEPEGVTYAVYAGSRNRWLRPGEGKDAKNDNFGFAAWVMHSAGPLVDLLGPGRHFGEWWGRKIGRTYGLDRRRFSLFNVSRYGAAPEVRDPRCYAPTIGGQELYEPRHKIHNGVKMCACRPAQEDISATLGDVQIAPVPVLYRGPWFGTLVISAGCRAPGLCGTACACVGSNGPYHGYAPALALQKLAVEGSVAAPGFMDPEGIVVFHEASGRTFKVTIRGDEKPKGVA